MVQRIVLMDTKCFDMSIESFLLFSNFLITFLMTQKGYPQQFFALNGGEIVVGIFFDVLGFRRGML
jgi:hypothetical protein